MKKVFSKIRDASKIFRKSFGNLSGIVLWASLLREKMHGMGELFQVRIPGIRHPVFLRAHTSDLEVFCQIFGHAELNIPLTKDAQYIIDAGANIGLTSIFLANRYPLAQIDAVEIDEDNLRVLRLNVAPYPNIKITAKGLWSHNTWLKILNPEAESWAFRVGETTSTDPAGIPALGVQDLMAARGFAHIDILKLDIEGSEVEVLGSGSDQWMPHVTMVAIELHDRFKPGCAQALSAAIEKYLHTLTQSGEYIVVTFLPSRTH